MKRTLSQKCFCFILVLLLLTSGITFAMKENKGKIPITTSSEEAKQNFLKGRDLAEKSKIHESFEYFKKAIDKDKNFALAYCYSAFANPTAKGAIDDVNRAVELTNKVSDGEKLMIMALKNATDGNFKMQEANLVKLVKMYPEDERAYNLLGTFYYGQQKFDKAITELKKSTEIAPDFSAAYNMLGYSFRNVKNYSEAEKTFKKYIELIPDDPNPYDSYAELLLKEGKYQESIEQYKKALSVDPNFFPSIYGMATDLVFLRKYEDARKELTYYNDKARDDAEKRTSLFGMTVTYIDEGNFDQALDQMQKQFDIAAKIDDAGAMTGDLNTMGTIMFEAGKYEEAMKKYDEALKTSVDSKLSNEFKENNKNLYLYNIARIQLMKDDLAGAKKALKEFSAKAVKYNNTFQIWLSNELEGHIAYKNKDYKTAIKKFKMSNMQNPYTFYYIGLAYKALGNNDKAMENFKTAAYFNTPNNLNQAFVRNKAEKMLAAQ